jgi:hypothetical protein
MKKLTPILDDRDRSEIVEEINQRNTGYTPELKPQAGSAGAALIYIFAHYLETLIEGLNRVPERSLFSFLDMLGLRLLPAQAARVPLMFELMESAPTDPVLPADSQMGAPVKPQPPSPLLVGEQAESAQSAIFATTQTMTIVRAKIAALYSLRPDLDQYADHTSGLVSGFTLFDGLQPTEHALYLGHDRLFALAGKADIRLTSSLGASDPTIKRELVIMWEYLSKDGWLPLKTEEDKTEALSSDGSIILSKSCGPDAKEETIFGHKSYWLRGRLLSLLPPQGDGSPESVPVIDTIHARVGFVKDNLAPEAAFADAFTLDTTKNFYPFGKQPERYTTFYLASRETFQRRGARVRMQVTFSEPGVGVDNLTLVWEYNDGNEWRSLDGFERQDGTNNFTQSGSISFLCPPDWAETSVNGQKNFWLRVRIANGSYGHPLRVKVVSGNNLEAEDSSLHPPVISSLKLQYTYQTESAALDHCLTFNDFAFSDRTHACRWPRETFEPFEPLADRHPAIYFGFDQALPSGLVSIYINVPDEATDNDTMADASAFIWEYFCERGWSELAVLDETRGFRRSGMLQFIGPRDAIRMESLGGKLYRIRARLKQSIQPQAAPVAGVWLNTAWATQRQVIKSEVLGDSDGNPGQTFHFLPKRVPVLEGEVIEAREWQGSGAGWETVIRDVPDQDLRLERNLGTNSVKAVWVRWHEQPHFFNSGPTDRHYVIERATGVLYFGDSRAGSIPLAGARILATYGSGGGLSGNVPAGSITELHSSVPYLKQFSNPVAATGGAATETLKAIGARGPQRIRHLDRAVSATDFEWLAHEASPAVARARCLPVTGPVGSAQRGWVTLILLPYDAEAMPQPSRELRRQVRDYLARRVPATISNRIRIEGPKYKKIGIVAEIVPKNPDEAAQVEARALDRLNKFLHPLTGGPDGEGWSFGQPIYLSQIATLIENLQGVDYALHIGLRADGQIFDESVPIDSNVLVTSGDHELKLTIGES